MADGDGATDIVDLSGNGKGVALNVYPLFGNPLVFDDVAAFPLPGYSRAVYVANDTEKIYRWDPITVSYIEISPGSNEVYPEQYGATVIAADNRASIQQALTVAGLIGARFVFRAMYNIMPQSDGAVLFNVPSGIEVTATAPVFGVKLGANAGNYEAIFSIPNGGEVHMHNFTIDENAQNNTTGIPTPGVGNRGLMAIKCYASPSRRARFHDIHFKNCGGVNTIALNSPDNNFCYIKFCHFSFFALNGASYDNSAIYVHGTKYGVFNNTFENLSPTNNLARTAIELHGSGYHCSNNCSLNYGKLMNIVTGSAGTANVRTVIHGNEASRCENGIALWAITGANFTNFEVANNNIEIDNNLYPNSVNVSAGISFITTTGVLGTFSHGSIHHNNIDFVDFVGNGINPNNSSSGIYLQLVAAGGSMNDIEVCDNIIRNAPNIGINIFQDNGTARRIHCNRNRVIDCGHNVANALRFSILWRGVAADCECMDNWLIDTNTGATAKGSNGLMTFFLEAGSSIVENNNQIVMSGTGRLINRSSQYATSERIMVLPWAATITLNSTTGAKLFSIDMTSVLVATVGIDTISGPPCAANSKIRFRIRNSSGGAPTLNWNAAFKLNGGAFATPGAGQTTNIEFITPDGGATWQETSRVTVTH